MIYLDKNYIRMLGSIPQALAACASFREYTKVVQLGERAPRLPGRRRLLSGEELIS